MDELMADLRRAIMNAPAETEARYLIEHLQHIGKLPADLLFIHRARFYEAIASIPGAAMALGFGTPKETIVNRTFYVESPDANGGPD